MRRFGKLVNLYLQGMIFYKLSFLFNLFTPFVLLGGQFMLWNALYGMSGGDGVIGSYDRKSMYTYIIVAFVINNLFTWGSENQLAREIRSGSVISRCMRPVPFLMQSLSAMTGVILPQAIVNFSFAGIFFAVFSNYLTLPALGNLPAAFFSLLLGVLLRMALVSWFSLLCFYTTSHLGLTWTRVALVEFFSGALVPVAMFPDWLKTFTYCTPFPLMLQTPISLFLGEPAPFALPVTYLLQGVWILVFFALHELMYSKIRRNMSFAGG